MVPTTQWRSALMMCVSFLAISVAVNVHAANSAADSAREKKAPPDREAVEAARKTCHDSQGLKKGERPTKEQREKIHECMKAAGFDRPPGAPPRPPHGPEDEGGDDHRPPPPPPEDQ